MSGGMCKIIRPAAFARRGRLTAIASGKGGVGKTWLAISLAHAMARAGRRTLLFDGDLGLANVDIQLGLMPQDDVGSVLAGRLTLPQAVTPHADGYDIIAGRSGSGRFGSAPISRLQHLCRDLIGMSRDYDVLILDLGAGVEQTVRQFSRNADTCLVIVTDEPTSLTDAYAFIKVAVGDRPNADIRIVVNIADSGRDGERTYATLLDYMSKSIAALIRLQGWRCEDGRRAVLATRARIASLQVRRQRLSETLAEERRTARALSADTVVDTTAYERRLAAEDAEVATQLDEAEGQHSAALDDLADALAEKRKLELAQAHYQEAARRAADRRERSALDEISLHRHARKRRSRDGV